ncbi:MAG: redoxin domain-containing protein [Cyclobacteriaceae bacterium]|nr:redoxin domain-containing protein [Cyclobacteriaceae bacterium]MCH8516648.1 redoxin domain-containing protein [Cyclobacteriaceae bacterium]
MKKYALLLLMTISIALIAFIFWHQELKYQLPTPVPKNWTASPLNEKVDLKNISVAEKPSIFHFYSTDCPCSKFNVKHIQSLVRNYSEKVDFKVVVKEDQMVAKAQKTFGEKVEVILDKDEAIAKNLGVYATPQAVVLKEDLSLYFRGNYNKSRYCTDPETYYVDTALRYLLAGEDLPELDRYAMQAYGCELF